MKTPLCNLLGIEEPVILAAMGGVGFRPRQGEVIGRSPRAGEVGREIVVEAGSAPSALGGGQNTERPATRKS